MDASDFELPVGGGAILADLVGKQEKGKTVFSLNPRMIKFLVNLTRDGSVTLSKVLDYMAMLLEEKAEDGSLQIARLEGERQRKSFAISEKARKTFGDLARKYGVSRDTMVENAIIILANFINEKALTPELKMQYAKTVLAGVNQMIKIYDSPEFNAALNALSESNDKDFGGFEQEGSCGETTAHLVKLYEMSNALARFIETKTAECNGATRD